MKRTIETEVIVVGSGPAGSSTALLLSTYGVANVMLNKYRWTANTPRARITNQGAMEILRELGLEADAMRVATPWEDMGDTVFCQSLAGEELGRLRTWGTHPRRRADYLLASPSEMCDIPQTLLEPILVSAAAARGTRLRLDTEYLSLTQDSAPAARRRSCRRTWTLASWRRRRPPSSAPRCARRSASRTTSSTPTASS